jgi:hypothetical protein
MDGLAGHVGWAVVAVAALAFLCFVAYLALIVFVIVRTGSTSGLRDVAAAMEAYRVPLVSWSRSKLGGKDPADENEHRDAA